MVGVAAEPGQSAYTEGRDGMSRYTWALVDAVGKRGHTDTVTVVLDCAASAVEREFRGAQRPVTNNSLAAVADWAYFPGVHGMMLLHDSAPGSYGSPTRVVDVVTKVLDEYERQVRCHAWVFFGPS